MPTKINQSGMMDYSHLLQLAKNAAYKAGEAILEVYGSDNFGMELKEDRSPLTRADRIAHKIIMNELGSSNLPFLSEEGRSVTFAERSAWDHFWMVDPIDGTKEFIKRNGDFTVNIALIKGNSPVLGVILVPVTKNLYHATKGQGAFKNGKQIHVNACGFADKSLKVVASRSHLNDGTKAFISRLNHPLIVSKGSSLKLLMVAEGEADIYPRYAPTMEWDTAAAHVIVTEAGGGVFQVPQLEPLFYNKANLLNPDFIVAAKMGDLRKFF